MANYGSLGLVQGLNNGIGMGMRLADYKQSRDRQQQLDQENRDYRQWQMDRAEESDALANELHQLNAERLQLGIDQANNDVKQQRMERLFNVWTGLSHNDDGSPRSSAEVLNDPRFSMFVNENDEIRDLLGAGPSVDRDRPYAGVISAREMTGNENDQRLAAVLRLRDGRFGPLTENRSGDPEDPIAMFAPDQLTGVIDSLFAGYNLTNRVSPDDYRTRQQKLEDEKRSDQRALQREKDKLDLYQRRGLDKDGKPIGGEDAVEFRQWISQLDSLYKARSSVEKGFDPLTGEQLPQTNIDTALATLNDQIIRKERSIRSEFPSLWARYADQGMERPDSELPIASSHTQIKQQGLSSQIGRQDAIDAARRAIASGKDKAAVIKRLEERYPGASSGMANNSSSKTLNNNEMANVPPPRLGMSDESNPVRVMQTMSDNIPSDNGLRRMSDGAAQWLLQGLDQIGRATPVGVAARAGGDVTGMLQRFGRWIKNFADTRYSTPEQLLTAYSRENPDEAQQLRVAAEHYASAGVSQ